MAESLEAVLSQLVRLQHGRQHLLLLMTPSRCGQPQFWARPTRRHDGFPHAMSCALAILVAVLCWAATAGASRRDAALSYTAAAQRDLVDSLPGWGPVDSFNLFSG